MNYKARWGPKGFVVSPLQVIPFDGFSTSIALKTDNGNDTSGTGATNTRGREPQTMTFTTKYLRSMGVNPRKQYEDWDAELGNSYPLYIGNKRFGPEKMKLTNVDVSELLLSERGDFISLTLNITLQEDTETTTTTTTTTTASSNAAAEKAAGTYAATVARKEAEKNAALNATASSSDKATMKT